MDFCIVTGQVLNSYEERKLRTRWMLEGSADGKEYFVIEDKSEAETDLSHDFIVREDGIQARFIRLTILGIPYHVTPCISGLRIFGKGTGEKPKAPEFTVTRSEDGLDLHVSVSALKDAAGYNILWGHKEDKLYHSYQIYRDAESVKCGLEGQLEKRIGALVKEQDYFVRVDAYNENGITKGTVVKL